MSQIINKSESYWRSEGQLANTPEFESQLHREFPVDASILEDPMTRRNFIKLMGASAALAGLAGCSFRKPTQTIFPYAKTPENLIPGKKDFFSTAVQVGDDVVGVLVASQEGRPLKIEGNPLHPASLGALKAWQQASVLELYDPDRLKGVKQKNEPSNLEAFESWWNDQEKAFNETGGDGLVLLAETVISPTIQRQLADIQKKYPKLRIVRYQPLNEDRQAQALRALTGKSVRLEYRFDSADIVVSFDSDFLGTDPGNLIYTKQFSSRRNPDSGTPMNRFYAIESRFSLTGGKADHRFSAKPSHVELALEELASALSITIPSGYSGSPILPSKLLKAIVQDLKASTGKSIVIAGPHLSARAQAVAAVINSALGNIAHTVSTVDPQFSDTDYNRVSSNDSLQALAKELANGHIKVILALGGNPVFSAPKELDLAKKFKEIKLVHLTLFENETSEVAEWKIPRSHYLEAWGDVKSGDGTTSIIQPLIEPMYDSVSDGELLSIVSTGTATKAYEQVRETWHDATDAQWQKWLHNGVVTTSPNAVAVSISPSGINAFPAPKLNKGIELLLTADYSIYDGRFSNNGWLQELPDPISKLTWDNAAYVSPKMAKRLGLKTSDVVTLKSSSGSVDAPVMIIPGHADNCVSIAMGYGREKTGRVGEKAGVNAFLLTTLKSPYVIQGLTLRKTGATYKLATTQEHGSLEGRVIYRQADLEAYKKNPDFAKEMVEYPPLVSSWEEKKYDSGYQWGMVIDLAKCTGCSACITACQAENNIPIVGKKQVLNSREMHWIRIDRYFEGPEDNPQLVQQPVTCLHCEMAPCEQVCPVAATTHSEEGLNDMTYNRCVGTRYCANNCPVKVRRFNFFDFHQKNPQSVPKKRVHFFDYLKEPDKTVQMQFNPDVSVRMRGVMEKCTYCVQRINKCKSDAKVESRPLVDGEIKTACQQTCPADAIVFGDIRDADSLVSKQKKSHRDYHLLAELNLKPRTSYLAGIRNPHPSLDKLESEVHH